MYMYCVHNQQWIYNINRVKIVQGQLFLCYGGGAARHKIFFLVVEFEQLRGGWEVQLIS